MDRSGELNTRKLLTAVAVIVFLNVIMVAAGLLYIEEAHPDYRLAALLLPVTILVNIFILKFLKRGLR